ncbi:MAG: HmuY family protein [Gemmatimonas sp.]
MRGSITGISRGAKIASALITVLVLGGCEDDASPTDPNAGSGIEAPVNTVVTSAPINGTSNDTLVAFSLAKNAVVPKSGDWDILIRRYEVRVNSAATAGASTKGVTAYSMNNNKSKTDAEVLAFSVDNTLAAFDAVRAAAIPLDTAFKTDRLEENQYGYLTLAGAPVVNVANYWKVKMANGAYSVFHATAIAYNAQGALTSLTLETRLQNGVALGAVQTLTIPFTGVAKNISLATNAVVATTDCTWDISVNPNTFEMITNSACAVGTSPGGSSPTFATATAANDAPQYLLFLTQLDGPIPNSFTDAGAPFRYNLLNTNRLHPTFNIYLVKVGTKVYKLQVINYYNESGTSGYPTIRSARIQ